MKEFVVHKTSRDPGFVSYSGPTLDFANARDQYREFYTDFQEAKAFADFLTPFNPGVGFMVSERAQE